MKETEETSPDASLHTLSRAHYSCKHQGETKPKSTHTSTLTVKNIHMLTVTVKTKQLMANINELSN